MVGFSAERSGHGFFGNLVKIKRFRNIDTEVSVFGQIDPTFMIFHAAVHI